MNKDELQEIIEQSKSLSDACKLLGFCLNKTGYDKFRKLVELNKCDISHFDKGLSKRVKYEKTLKKCPVCNKEFVVKAGAKKEKKTCSYSCSNTFFRSGKDNPNWKDETYRTTCFLYHKKECVVCGENKIIDVHHFDEDKKNNTAENLIPLCPTHHMYWHSRYKDEIFDTVIEYRKRFIKKI